MHSGTRTLNPSILSDVLPTELAGLDECCPSRWPCYINVLPIPMFTCLPCYKYQNDEVERNLSCKCTVLCYILECMYILQITRGRIGPVLAFNVQIPDQVECLAVFACWKQAQDLCLFAICTKFIYIPICNTKQYIYQTKYAVLDHSRTYNYVYISMGSTGML